MDIKVSNTEKSKNNLEKHMKVGPPTLYIYIYISGLEIFGNFVCPQGTKPLKCCTPIKTEFAFELNDSK